MPVEVEPLQLQVRVFVEQWHVSPTPLSHWKTKRPYSASGFVLMTELKFRDSLYIFEGPVSIMERDGFEFL